MVSQWCSGKKRPTAEKRAVLEADYGVPSPWWDEPLVAVPASPPIVVAAPEPERPPMVVQRPALVLVPPVPPTDEAPVDDEAPARGESALELARGQVRALQRSLRLAAPGEALDIQKALTQAIATQGRLERADEARVARILKSPECRRVIAAIVGAIKPFGTPVLRAVDEALAALEAEDETPAETRAA